MRFLCILRISVPQKLHSKQYAHLISYHLQQNFRKRAHSPEAPPAKLARFGSNAGLKSDVYLNDSLEEVVEQSTPPKVQQIHRIKILREKFQ